VKRVSKIIYLIASPFNRRDFERFGFGVFIKDGFDVSVWDFTPFLFEEVHRSVTPPDPVDFENLVQYSRKRDAIEAINKNRDGAIIISMIPYNIDTCRIYRAMWKNRIPHCVWTSNALPASADSKQVNSLFQKIKRVNLRKAIGYMSYIFLRNPGTFFKIGPATFALAGGSESLINKMRNITDETEVLWIHTFDYDIYLNSMKSEQEERNIAVFLDDYFPFHSDYTYYGVPAPIEADEYYPVLCSFFDFVEEKTDLEVVIAAHPRSHYEDLPDYFGGRTVIRGKSAELVRSAKFVILSCSTSINFPVLYRKPMIFITTDALEKSVFGKYTSQFASIFRKTPININRPLNIDIESELSMYKKGYDQYKNEFIKKEGSEELPFWQVVSNRIRLEFGAP